MRVRRAVLSDVPAVDDLLKAAAEGLGPAVFCRDEADFLAEHVEKAGFILLAEEDAPAGMVLVRFPDLAEDHLGWALGWTPERLVRACHLESIAVHPRYRGRGLQRLLLQAAEEALSAEYADLLATVAPENIASLRNFRRMGYEVTAEVRKYGGYDRYILLKHRI